MADLEIKGKTLTAVTQLDNSEVLFAMADGAWRMWHSQGLSDGSLVRYVKRLLQRISEL